MTDLLSTLLAERDYLLADGAIGTNLMAMGLQSGEAPDLWNVDHGERVAALHRQFIEAGSDIILTNTFGANRYRLKLHGDEDRVDEINRAGARLAREEASRAGRPVVVGGSMGPTGEIFRPVGELSIEEGIAAFAEQSAALAVGGVDAIWIETVSAAEEVNAAVEGASRTGLPVVVTMTFDTAGRTMMGLTPEDAVRHARGLPHGLAAFGANCGVGPGTLVDTVLGLRRGGSTDDVIVAKGNCGIPEYRDGDIVYSGSHEIMADYARMARDVGARIIGGCCGTTAGHIRAMAQALAAHDPRTAPDRHTIESVLGPVAAGAQAASDEAARGRRGGRRRRG